MLKRRRISGVKPGSSKYHPGEREPQAVMPYWVWQAMPSDTPNIQQILLGLTQTSEYTLSWGWSLGEKAIRAATPKHFGLNESIFLITSKWMNTKVLHISLLSLTCMSLPVRDGLCLVCGQISFQGASESRPELNSPWTQLPVSIRANAPTKRMLPSGRQLAGPSQVATPFCISAPWYHFL